MSKYQATPGAKTIGNAIHTTVESLGPFKETGYRLLTQAGISALKDDEWYDQQIYCNFLELIQQKVGNSTLFISGRNQGLGAG